MGRHLKMFFPCILLLAANAAAQTNTWKIEKTDDEKIIVKSHVSERVDDAGNTLPLIEYVATTTDDLTMQRCIAIMKDASKHKYFLDVKVSEKVKALSKNEWVNYYVFNAPWPFSPTECVAKVVYIEDAKNKTVAFVQTAAPTLMKPTDLKRFTYYNFTYAFKDIGNGKVEVSVTVKMALPSKVPLWILRSSLPESAADPLRKLIQTIKAN
jgi:hypothetical protein